MLVHSFEGCIKLMGKKGELKAMGDEGDCMLINYIFCILSSML